MVECKGLQSTSEPAIFRLDRDILLEAFRHNTGIRNWGLKNYFYGILEPADMANQAPGNSLSTPLATTRLCSQVCASWRDLILTSPLLWANSLDFDELKCSRSDQWANEVFQRTGKGLLSVKAVLHENYSWALSKLLATILDHHWTRIQSLEFQLSTKDTIVSRSAVKAFGSPAPYLVSFRVLQRILGLPIQGLTTFNFFSNQAWLLRSLYLTQLGIPFSLEPSVLSNLTHFGTSQKFEVSEIIQALVNMPRLQSLILHKFHQPNIGVSSYPQVHLPCLEFLDIIAGLRACNILLDQLTFPHGCILNIRGDNRTLARSESNSNLDSLRSRYTSYLEGFLTQYSVESLSIGLHMASIRIHKSTLLNTEYSKYTQGTRSQGPQLYITSTAENLLLDLDKILKFVLPVLSVPRQHSKGVSSLYLNFSYTNTRKLLASTPAVLSYLLSGFPAVSNLAIYVPILEFMVSIADEHPDLFPHLSVLEIMGTNPNGRIEALFPFLDWRTGIGRPIKVLDMTRCHSWNFEKEDIAYYDALPPMKLIYNDYKKVTKGEYICGGGVRSPDVGQN